MNLLSPLAGVLLFASVVVPLVALYFLRLRRTRRVISSTLPWVGRTEDIRANAPFQRIRPSLLLFMQLLLLLLLALAIAQPTVRGWGLQGARVVMVVDCSASMNTLDASDGGSRLNEAKALAVSRVQSLQGGGLFAVEAPEIMVISISQGAEVRTPFTRDASRVRHAISAIAPTDEGSLLEPALELARAYQEQRTGEDEPPKASQPLVLELFSDGKLHDLDHARLRAGERMVWTRVGSESTTNSGFAAVGCERGAEDPSAIQTFAAIRNFNAASVSREVELRSDGVLLASTPAPVVVPSSSLRGEIHVAGEKRILFGGLSTLGQRLLEVSLSPSDALTADDRGFISVRASKPLTLAVIGHDDSLEALVSALAPGSVMRLDLSAANSAIAKDPRWADGFDVVLSVGQSPKSMDHGRWLHFGSIPSLAGLHPFGEPGRDFVQSVRGEHPALRQCNLNELVIQQANRVAVQSGWRTLVQGQTSPLVVAGSTGSGFAIVVTFLPGDSNWPFQRGFVNFTAQAIDLLSSMADGSSEEPLEPGAMIRARLSQIDRTPTITPPGGVATPMVMREGEASWGPARRAGSYKLEWVSADGTPREQWIAVNLMDSQECDVAAATTLNVGGETVTRDVGGLSTLDLWPWLIGLAVALLLMEWWVYHRQAMQSFPFEPAAHARFVGNSAGQPLPKRPTKQASAGSSIGA